VANLSGYSRGKLAAIRTWQVLTGKAGRAWTDDSTLEGQLAVHPDGKMLATMNLAGVIRLWELATGKEIRPSHASPCGLEALTYLEDGKKLRTVGIDLSLREWDAETGKVLRRTRFEGKAWFPTFSSRGRYLVAPYLGEEHVPHFRIYDLNSGDMLMNRQGRLPLSSLDEMRLAFHENESQIQVLDLATRKIVNTLKTPKAWPIAFSADGRRLVLQSDELSVWDVRTGKPLSSWKLSERKVIAKSTTPQSWERIESIAVSPDGETVAIGVLKDGPRERGLPGWFGRVMIFTAAGKLVHQIDLSRQSPTRLVFAPDGKRLAMSGPGRIHLWDVKTGKSVNEFAGHRGPIRGLAFRPDGKRLASASEDSTVLIWDVADR
jgi:WD40 repeat protein